jgi:hypothetical protein
MGRPPASFLQLGGPVEDDGHGLSLGLLHLRAATAIVCPFGATVRSLAGNGKGAEIHRFIWRLGVSPPDRPDGQGDEQSAGDEPR